MCGSAEGLAVHVHPPESCQGTHIQNSNIYVLIYNGDWDACVPYTDNEARCATGFSVSIASRHDSRGLCLNSCCSHTGRWVTQSPRRAVGVQGRPYQQIGGYAGPGSTCPGASCSRPCAAAATVRRRRRRTAPSRCWRASTGRTNARFDGGMVRSSCDGGRGRYLAAPRRRPARGWRGSSRRRSWAAETQSHQRRCRTAPPAQWHGVGRVRTPTRGGRCPRWIIDSVLVLERRFWKASSAPRACSS